ncbi:MAG: acetyltransferase [Balneola sp.]
MSNHSDQHLKEAEVIRQACIKAAKEGFMDASISGLCTEGTIEAAISAIQNLDLSRVLKD